MDPHTSEFDALVPPYNERGYVVVENLLSDQQIQEAEAEIETWTAEQAKTNHGKENIKFIDLRDIRELYRTGKIATAFHAPRGMLEFWVCPESVIVEHAVEYNPMFQ
mgnify:CR=1 FL=1